MEIEKNTDVLITMVSKEVLEEELRESIIELIEGKQVTEACHELAAYLLRKHHILTFSDTSEIFIYIDGVYTSRGEEIIQKEIQQILRNYCKLHLVNEIVGHIKRSTIVNRSIIKEPIDKVCLQNGILDLNTLGISPHDPKIIFFNKIPVYHISGIDCPKIKKFLSEIVDESGIPLIQEFFGYCLYKEHFIHKAFMLVGSGANGKSTLLRLLKVFLGTENVSSIPLQSLESNRFAISSLFSKLANIFADLSSRGLSGTSIFKMLVGQDLIPAEKKFRDQFFFENYAKLIFSANQIPKSPEDSDAFFRRWIIINFPNQFFKTADKHLIKKLTTTEEMSGLLNFAIEGLKRLIENGDFSNNKSLEQVREQYIRMSDSVGAFVMDAVLVSPEGDVTKEEIYLAYCDYCKERSYPIISKNTFHRDLIKSEKIRVEDYRPVRERDGKKERVQCWKGITINYLALKLEKNLDKPDITDIKEENGQRGQGCQDNSLFKVQKDDEDVNPVNDVKVKYQLEDVNDDSELDVSIVKPSEAFK